MMENTNRRPTAKPYQGKKKQRWPTRIVVALVSVGGLLGLWQFVAHEPAAAHATPSFEDAEQQLQLGPASTNQGDNNNNNGSAGSSSGNSPSSGVLPPPDTFSGSS